MHSQLCCIIFALRCIADMLADFKTRKNGDSSQPGAGARSYESAAIGWAFRPASFYYFFPGHVLKCKASGRYIEGQEA